MTKAEINDSLRRAAERGDIERLKALVAEGADVNAKNYLDETVLMKAVQTGNLDCVELLIAAGADVNAKDHLDKTVLMKAAEKGSVDCVNALIGAGAEVNAPGDRYLRQTVLMKAIMNGNSDCVQALITAGAEMNPKDHIGWTALMVAAEKGSAGCVQALIAAGADVNAKDIHSRPVLNMAHRSVKGILRAAGAKRKIPFKDIGLMAGALVVWAALAFGIAVLMHRLSPSFSTWGARLLSIVSAPLMAFCVIFVGLRNSRFSAYRRLLLFGWATLAFGIAALMHWLSPWFPTWAAAGLFGLVAAPIICPLALLLPEPKPLPSRRQINAKGVVGKTPLMEAAENGDLRRVKRLIAKGADVNAQQEGYSCSTALILAVEKGSTDCTKALMAAGADVDAKDHIGRTALILAVEKGSTDCVKALMAAGADVNAKDHIGRTALDSSWYRPDIAAILQAANSATPYPAPPAAAKVPTAVPNTPENNLSRWKASGNPEKWVRQHNLKWGHQDWLDLLASLRRSEFWPMEPDAIGRVLEEQKNAQLSAAKPMNPPSKASAASAPTASKAQPGIRYKLVLNDEEPNLLAYDGGSPEAYYERLSKSLISRHGPLVGVDFNTHPDQLFFRYKDGYSVFSGKHTSGNHDISCMGFGYVGTGPRHLRHFLSAAGLELTSNQIESRKSGESIETKDGKPVIVHPSEQIVDSKGVKFLEERTTTMSGSTAQATVRHYEAANKTTARNFLEKQKITARALYIVVSTPEGDIGKDVLGIYEQ